MNFYTFCIANGQTPFVNQTEVIDNATGVAALEMMYALYHLLDKSMFDKNPIAVANAMSSTNDYWYCPFAYGYSNYARVGYAQHTLHYTDVVCFNNKHLQTTIGGTGLSVSAFSEHKEVAVDFAKMVCAGTTQAGLYVQSGGQPGHLKAWTDPLSNTLTNNFFQANLPAMQRGYMRPRYHGYLHFQDHGGDPIRDYLMGKISSPLEVLATLNNIYHQSLAHTVCS
jgi:multiple sugar transport system substrate-binding protein